MSDGQRRPRSLLFLSCDLTGSTAYKQQPGVKWERTFLSFYREFPQVLGELVEMDGSTNSFTLWKAIGDELIFWVEPTDEAGVFDAVRLWLRAMDAYEDGTLESESLGTTGGAFMATFPGPDSECAIPRDPKTQRSDKGVVVLNDEALSERDDSKYQFDFFGPSIDTGFRVLGASTRRFFTLSVEVAWAMQQCNRTAKDDDNRLVHQSLQDLDLLSVQRLKGVWGDREYPVFAIDRQNEDAVHKAIGKLAGTPTNLKAVGSVCEACLASEGWPSAIYLPGSAFGHFKVEPQDRLAELVDNEMIGAESAPSPESGETMGGGLTPEAPLG